MYAYTYVFSFPNKGHCSSFKALSLNLALTLGCLNPNVTNPNPNPNSNPNLALNLIKTLQSAKFEVVLFVNDN